MPKKPAAKAPKPRLLAGGNPQIAKGDGDAPVQAYIKAIPGWKREVAARLDAIITFNALTPDVMETIVEKFILQLETQLAERRVAITLENDARAWLGKKGFDPIFGARPLARVIQTTVRDPLTDEILFGKLENGGTVRIGLDAENDKLSFTYE